MFPYCGQYSNNANFSQYEHTYWQITIEAFTSAIDNSPANNLNEAQRAAAKSTVARLVQFVIREMKQGFIDTILVVHSKVRNDQNQEMIKKSGER